MFKRILKELSFIAIFYVILFLVIDILFTKQPFDLTLKIVNVLVLCVFLPGYLFMLYWIDNLDLIERFVIGAAIMLVLVNFLSYYLGLVGLDTKHHHIILPFFVSILGIVLFVTKK